MAEILFNEILYTLSRLYSKFDSIPTQAHILNIVLKGPSSSIHK